MLVAAAGQGAVGQGETKPTSALPAELEGLKGVAFLDKGEPLADKADAAAVQAIRQRAAGLLKEYDFKVTPTSEYPVLYRLHRLAGGSFEPAIHKEMREALEARIDDWTDKPYDDIRGKIALMLRLKLQLKAFEEAQRWIAAGGTLNKIEQSAQGQEDLKDPYAPIVMKVLFGNAQMVYGTFTAVWEGRVNPPQNGDYTFFISPINANGVHDDYQVRQSMSVSVGGKTVIEATPDSWVSRSEPVALTAGTSVTLRVETKIESANSPRAALHAMLFWQGPDGKKTMVPNDALLMPTGEEHGLKATYSWKKDGKAESITETARAIDFAWPLGGLLVSGNSTRNQAADAMAALLWDRVTSDQVLDALEKLGELHPLLQSAGTAAGLLTSAQRQSFIKTLVLRKVLLDPIEPMPFLWIFRTFRMGAADEALELLAAWGERKSGTASTMPDSVAQVAIDYEMRKACRRLAICIAHEVPEQQGQLRDQFLSLTDGSCNLPVAYILGYAYQRQGKMREWIAFLDKRLADNALVGDRRVSWLIARAHADEIKGGGTGPFAPIGERVLEGEAWLKEASLHAQSPAMKVRVAKEQAARLAAVQAFDAARAKLDEAGRGAPPELVAELGDAKWRVDSFEAMHVAQRERQGANGQGNYQKMLRERRQAASERSDGKNVGRYDKLIKASEAP